MAKPLSAAAFLAALRAEGVKVKEVGDWPTHNRNHKGPWGPANGVMIHHTVTSGTDASVRICRDGYAALPGPLCHGVIDKTGVVHLVGHGRTNHAGGGDPKVLARVIAEDYGDRPPKPTQGNTGGEDGNARFYGFECVNLGDGKDPWPPAQLDAIERASAALCRAHGWGAKSVVGHAEWSSDKVDPRGVGMPGMRDRIATRLKHPASWSRGSSKPTNPAPPKETPVATTDSKVTALHSNLLTIGSLTEVDGKGARVNHGAGYYLAHIERDTTALQLKVDRLEKTLAEVLALLKTKS
ncbi:N-acetylmuramoyl-L-alanine amidase [Streptomyces sp. NPDC050509]|uniref:N-acetylmuramoyl-L-alanine amidase n=1 Tax=Streptomyces sp. NPDC050509 TaxID=3365620 RepID=UPI003792243C